MMNRSRGALVFMGCLSILCTGYSHIGGHSHPNVGESVPEGHVVRPDVTLVLSAPYDTILYGETDHLYLGIRNESDTPLMLHEQLDSEHWEQLVFQARKNSHEKNLVQLPFVPTWERLKDRAQLVAVEKNDSRTYSYMPTIYNFILEEATQVRACLITGPNEWVFSDWIKLTRSKRSVDEFEILETIHLGQTPEEPIRRVEIDGVSYIFLGRSRIACVPEGATPRFEWDKKQNLLTIHFDGVDVPPLIHFAPMIETREWTPETAPHAEALKNLRREMGDEREPSPSPAISMSNVEPSTHDIEAKPSSHDAETKPAVNGKTADVPQKKKIKIIWVLLGVFVVLGGLVHVFRKAVAARNN